MVGCIPEVLTLLLTPISTYIHLVYDSAPYMSYMSYKVNMTYISGRKVNTWKKIEGKRERGGKREEERRCNRCKVHALSLDKKYHLNPLYCIDFA